MLFAILYDSNGNLLGAAPACEQTTLQGRYWSEVYSGDIDINILNLLECETAYAEIPEQHIATFSNLARDNDLKKECQRIADELTLGKYSSPAPKRRAA